MGASEEYCLFNQSEAASYIPVSYTHLGGEPFSRRVPLPPPISHNNLLPERHAHVAVDEHVRLHVLADGLRRGGGKLREDFVGIAL